MDFFFPPLVCPKIFPPPTYHLPPPLTPSPELQRHQAGASLELEPGLLEQELGAGAWSCRSFELGAVGAWELWLEPERDPRRTRVSVFTLFCSCGAALQRSVAKKVTLRCLGQRSVTFPLLEQCCNVQQRR
jgi:hypothetical protein